MPNADSNRPLRHSQRLIGNLIGEANANNEIDTSAITSNKDGSILERLEFLQAASPFTLTGTTDIDDSVQTETTAYNILDITPASGAPCRDVEVWFDLAKATTGFGAVESSITVQFAVARKVDGTNWRREAYQEAALSGTNAAARMAKITVGKVTATQGARIYAVFSSDVTSDMEIPYVVTGYALADPTVTPVEAG